MQEKSYILWRMLKLETKICKVCHNELEISNFFKSSRGRKGHRSTCKKCCSKQVVDNRHRNGVNRPYSESRYCSHFLGVHVAERVLYNVYKNVQKMPFGNPGYDFICNKGYKIDVKSSCLRKCVGHSPTWEFDIKENKIADYFLLIAFDNRSDLNPMHVWLVPSDKVNCKKCIGIANLPKVLNKWIQHEKKIDQVVMCCNVLKGECNAM